MVTNDASSRETNTMTPVNNREDYYIYIDSYLASANTTIICKTYVCVPKFVVQTSSVSVYHYAGERGFYFVVILYE